MRTTAEGHERADIVYAGISVSLALPSRDDHIAKVLLTTGGFYEQAMLAALAPALKENDLVVDVGANIGNHTLFFAKVLGCRVLAFEAVPATAGLLAENVRINGVEDRVRVFEVALGEQDGRARVEKFDPANVGAATLSVDAGGDIPVRALDSIDTGHPVRLLKIDVEGMELAVLKGAHRLIAQDRPWLLCEAADASAASAVRGFLDGLDYSVVAVFNATDTYLCLPARTDEERRVLAEHALLQQRGDFEQRIVKLEGRLARREREMAETKQQLVKAEGLVARRERESERQIAQLRDQATKAEGLAGRLQRELVDVRQVLTKSEGLAGRQRRELADKDRRIAEAHRQRDMHRTDAARLRDALGASREESKALRAELSALREEMGALRNSLSHRLGRTIVEGLHSPMGAVRLLWRVPRMLLAERRRRALAGGRPSGPASSD